MAFNYVDLIAAIILVLYLARGIAVGFWPWANHFISLIVSVYLGILLYMPIGDFLNAHVHTTLVTLTPIIWYVISFILVMAIVQTVLSICITHLFKKHPKVFFENRYTRILALIPAALEGLIVLVFLIIISNVLPIPTNYSQDIARSFTGKTVSTSLPVLGADVNGITDGRFNQALALLTTRSESSEHAESLSFRPSSTNVDEDAEQQMLVLVNQERAKAGVGPLTIDPTLTAVARAHSQDMWERQYFSHITPDGLDPFDRMHAAGITYETAGENIALAPTVTIAHIGLMNSPGHRANILNPAFHYVGIGVVDGGLYGKMFTQDFTN